MTGDPGDPEEGGENPAAPAAPPEPPAPPRRGVRLVLRGRVQGVGFRYFVRQLGRQLGLAGRVRNLLDGRVEIEAAGDPDRVEELKQWARQGPPGALVTGMDEHSMTEVPPWDSFEIDREKPWTT
ncbi:MAG TPA: acylphosphatase [Thermoanaerobaculia bacterium]|nr:acylphosphatase [Thermoanaerobaculia bacterium]